MIKRNVKSPRKLTVFRRRQHTRRPIQRRTPSIQPHTGSGGSNGSRSLRRWAAQASRRLTTILL